MPLISVIIPCYNKSDVISVTIDSVLAQTYEDFEIIIIDDGSTDNSIEVINTYKDSRIRLIPQQNSGVSVTRNIGIKEAIGSWIAFLDADDWWHPNYLKVLVNNINSNPSVQFIGTQFYSLADKKGWKPNVWVNQPTQSTSRIITNLPKEWILGIPFFTSSVCIQKNILFKQSEPFKPRQSQGEDLDLWFRLAEQTSILNITQPLVVYRTEQTSSLSTEAFTTEEPYHIKSMQQRLNTNNIPTHLITSSKYFIAQDKLTRARLSAIEANRIKALQLIFEALFVIKTKRWWVSLIMALFASKKFIKKWMLKNSGRKELTN